MRCQNLCAACYPIWVSYGLLADELNAREMGFVGIACIGFCFVFFLYRGNVINRACQLSDNYLTVPCSI